MYLRILLIAILIFLNVFDVSGFAFALNVNRFYAYVFAIYFFFDLFRPSKFHIVPNKTTQFLLLGMSFYILCLILIDHKNNQQIINFLTTFGIIGWVSAFARVRWRVTDLFGGAVVAAAMSLIMIFFLMPGGPLSGWNPNSGIGVVPSLLFSIATFWIFPHKYRKILLIAVVVLAVMMLQTLKNRNSVLAIAVLVAFLFYRRCYLNRTTFRWIYITIIVLNVLIPFISNFLTSEAWFNDFVTWTQGFIKKGDQFGGRQDIWPLAIYEISKNGLFGSLGIRTFYYHNMALDILLQFGWPGLLTFVAMVIVLLERCFVDGSRFNVYVMCFLAVYVLDTFENISVANSYFMPLTFLLLAIPLALNTKYFGNRRVARQ